MYRKSLLAAGLAQAIKVQRPDQSPYTDAALAALQQNQTPLLENETCYPSVLYMFDNLDDALAQKGSGLFEDDTYADVWELLYSSTHPNANQGLVGDGNSNPAGPSPADLIAGFNHNILDDWERPSYFDGEDYSLWGANGIGPTDVYEGQVGSCWMLAALSALAENPSRIEKLFASGDQDSDGFYVLEFFFVGEPVYIVVDDRLPVYLQGEEDGPYMGRRTEKVVGQVYPYNAEPSVDGAWWAVIVEKAYAKFYKTYADLNGGYDSVALRQLTGMPVKSYTSASMSETEIWETIKEADENQYVTSASVWDDEDGLVSGHAYTVLGVNESSGLIKIRNPWGIEYYTGLGSDQNDDGYFEVPVDIFKRNFKYFNVLLYDDWFKTQTGIQGIVGSQNKSWTLRNEESQQVIVTVDLALDQIAEYDCQDGCKIWLSSRPGGRGQYVNSTWNSQGIIDFGFLPAGDIEISLGWASCAQTDFNIQAYGSSSHVHMFTGDIQVSEEVSAEYVQQIVTAIIVEDSETETEQVSSDSEPAACVDGLGTDSYGDGCDWYTNNQYYCGSYDSPGFTSATECCACK